MVKPYSELNFIGRWFRIFCLSGEYFVREKIGLQAQALTYYTLFFIVPFAALCFGIAKGFALDKVLRHMLDEHYAQHGEILKWLYQFADSALEHAQGGLIAGVGVILLFFTVIRLAANVEDTFNSVWRLPKRRNTLGKFSNYVSLLVVTPFLLIVIGSGLVVAKTLLTKLIMSCPAELGAWLMPLLALTNFVSYVIAWVVFTGIYYCVPNTQVRIGSAITGGIVAGTVFQLLQSFLIVIQSTLSGYNAIYGSFSMLPLFLLWMQWSWQITLYGAVLTFVHQNAPSGKLELHKIHCSRRERELYLLGITQMTVRYFTDGNGAIDSETLRETLQLQPSQISSLTGELCKAGVLFCVAEDRFVPALPGPELTIQRMRDLLENAGNSGTDTLPELEPIKRQLEALHEETNKSAENRALGEIK